jgi:hypothetical protein
MSSNAAWVIGAVLLQGVLTLAVLGLVSWRRVKYLRSGEVLASEVVLSREPWPAPAKQASNTFDNQFQLPVLFYVAAGLLLYIGPTALEIGLLWLFAVSRWFHAAFYVTANKVPYRATAFSVGFAALIVLWADLIIRFFAVIGHAPA